MDYLTSFWLSSSNTHPASFVNRLIDLLRRFQKQINRQTLEALEIQIKTSCV